MCKLTNMSKLNNMEWKHKIEIGQGVKCLFEWYNKDISDLHNIA